MRKAVVTGGAGFIGSHIAERLADSGYHTVILDDLSTGKFENIEHLLKKKNTEFIQGSITDLALLKQVFSNSCYVFHQAAIPSVPRSIDNPLASHNVNITGTLNVLLASRDNNVKKVVFSSSSSVYGDTPVLPKTEDMIPNPQSPYAVTKLAAEHYCQVFNQVFGLKTVSLRYFNVFGPRQDPDSQYAAVIPLFIKRVFTNKPPIIFGNGKQTRDFTYVNDVVEANILAAESDACGIFNIGGGKNQITIEALARIIIELTGKNIDPVYEKPRPGDIKHSLADISKAEGFGYKPKYSLEQGLELTIRDFNYAK